MTIKCAWCGRFMKVDENTEICYTPDSEYSVEKIHYFCKKCELPNRDHF